MSAALVNLDRASQGYFVLGGPILENKTLGKRKSPEPEKIDHTKIYKLKSTKTPQVYFNNRTRTFVNYESVFRFTSREFDLKTFIETRPHKITVLDSGAGEGTSMSDLLTRYASTVIKCTGISMHYFSGIAGRIKSHGGRLEWYVEKAEVVLPHINEQYDLITDLFGAYFYSPERLVLLENYHRHLTINGRAYIYRSQNLLFNILRHADGRIEYLEDSLIRAYPDTFSWAGTAKTVFIITKTSTAVTFWKYRIERMEEKCWGYAKKKNLSPSLTVEGQGWYPSSVIFAPAQEP